MRKVLPLPNGRFTLQLLAVAAVSALVAGCSSDATRLGDPFANPFHTSSTEPARHVASADGIPAGRTAPVSSHSLAAPSAVASAAPLRPNLTRTAAMQPISHETTGSIEAAPARSARGNSYGGWTSSGGVPITVGDNEGADVLAKRYGVPETALLETNGLSSPSDVHAGSTLVIPVYNAAASQPAHVAAAAPSKATLMKPRADRAAAAKMAADKVARGEPEHVLKAPAAAGQAQKTASATPGKTDKAAPRVAAKPQPAAPAPKLQAAAPVAKGKDVAAAPAPTAPATKTAQAKPPVAPVAPKVEPAPQQTVADASGTPEFRWPAHGRIIHGFQGNDGINIALPDGTPVKAAEAGTVAYAGSELKGYGNLVLIRHPNGFVTAYANNGELDVKRGDTVKRGQVIAKSGQSGNVSSPQLHFELRKGSTPVDPTTYLAGL